MKRWVPFLLIFAVAIGALAGGALFYRAKVTELSPKPINLADQKAGAESAHFRGEAGAAVIIEEFGDFQCPPCADLWPVLAKIERDYGAKLNVVFRQYPLAMHKHADLAARAAEAAGQQGRFWEMHDLLYRNQAIWSQGSEVEGIFNKYAFGLGLEIDRFKADLAGEEVKSRIKADQERANSMGVRSTPSVFLNNTLLPFSVVNEAGLRTAIDNVLDGKPPVPAPSPTPTPPTS